MHRHTRAVISSAENEAKSIETVSQDEGGNLRALRCEVIVALLPCHTCFRDVCEYEMPTAVCV